MIDRLKIKFKKRKKAVCTARITKQGEPQGQEILLSEINYFASITELKAVTDDGFFPKGDKKPEHYTDGTQQSQHISFIASYYTPQDDQMSVASSYRSSYRDRGSIWSVRPDEIFININTEDYRPDLRESRIHNMFVKKVFGILTLQYLFMVLFAIGVKYINPVYFNFSHYGLTIGITFVSNYLFVAALLFFSSNVRNHFPFNLTLLVLITIFRSVWLNGFFSYMHEGAPLFIAIISFVVAFTIFLIALQRKYDITANTMCCWTVVYVFLVTGGVVGSMVYFKEQNVIYIAVITGAQLVFAIVWMIFLLKRVVVDELHLTCSDYIWAALVLYVELFLLYLFIAEVIKSCR